VLHEGAARRGLDAECGAVLLGEMEERLPPPGVAGPQQLRDWLASALESGAPR
jgi:hypothetical protein